MNQKSSELIIFIIMRLELKLKMEKIIILVTIPGSLLSKYRKFFSLRKRFLIRLLILESRYILLEGGLGYVIKE
jgi:hypothetical protein